MDVDLAFSANTTHSSWGIHSNEINATHSEEEPGKDINKRKEMKKLKELRYANINKSKEEDREMKKSLMKKLRLSWMGCSKQ